MTSKPPLESWSPPRPAPRRSVPPSNPRLSQITGVILGERYRIKGILEQGAHRRAYLAEDLESGGAVVIKRLPPKIAANAELSAQITSELERTLPVRHPNLLELLGIGETPAGELYLVMESVEGVSLEELLRARTRLDTDLALVLSRQAAAGLIALHRAGVVHGELNESTVMVLGGPEHPYGAKLIGYGAARLFDEPRPEPERESTARLAAWAPEQILGEPVDARTDVYGVGALLFRMLLGRPLLDLARPSGDVAERVLGPLAEEALREPDLDPELATIIANATRKRPDNRYSSVEALLADLDAKVGLSPESIAERAVERSPDRYEPQTESGRERLERLSLRSAPPPADADRGAAG